MAIRTYKVTLDSKNTIAPEPVFLRQGDKTGAVVIDATLMDNGAPVSLSDLTPMFKANTADGQAVIIDSTGFNIVNASGGEFTYQVPNALSAVPGKIVTAYFSFSDTSGTESTFDVAFIIKKAVDTTQAQADDYITIVDGTLQSLQQKIDAMNTDVKTILDAFNQGDFYNKAQTDAKDAATLTSAKSYADTQDTSTLASAKSYADNKDAATLASAKSYTNDSINGVISIPETFTNLAAIVSKYPNGSNGVKVAGDNGHKYIWDGKAWADAGIYQAVGFADESVIAPMIKDQTINYNQVDFLKVSANKFNVLETQVGGFHNYTTGVWSANTDFDTSGKIPCRPGQVWTSQYVRWVCYFDKNKSFKAGGFAISGGQDELKTFTIPADAYYFEVTCQIHNTAKQQIEQSAILSDYNEFELKIDNLKTEIDSVNDIKNDSLTIDKMEFIDTGKNLFNPNVAVTGYYINPTTGKLNEAANYITSKFIPVYGRPIGLKNVRFYALFSKNGEYLSGETLNADKLIAENAINAFIRVSPNSGSEGSTQVEYDAITAFESYRAVLKGVSTESETSDKPSINLPKNIFATTNKELVIYQQNIALDDYAFRWGRGIQGDKSYRETFVDITDKNLSIELYKDAKLINSKPVKITVSAPRTDNLKVMLLGDSTVDSLTTDPPSQARLGYHMLQEMGDNLTLVGSRGLGSSKHEGRGGWTAKDYRSNKTDETGANPFYSLTTQDFDFSYYMSQTGFDAPNVVVLQLGINDLFNYTSDDTALVKINEFISDIEYIAANIKAYDPNIKIAYNIAIPPNEKIDVFAETYQQYNLPQWRYKRNNNLLASKVIAVFDDSQTIVLNAIHKGINVFENLRDGVHPTDTGYAEIASQIVDYLNSLA